jgi:hypothetical protein
MNAPIQQLEPTGALSKSEAAELAECEEVLRGGLRWWVDSGSALDRIREGRLYRATHPTFEDYCRTEWGISRVHAHRLIDAAGLVLPIGNSGLPAPATESVARELLGAPEDERIDLWREVLEVAADGKVTAKTVRDVFTDNLLAKLTPQARDRIGEAKVTPGDLLSVLKAGADADPAKRALAEKQAASAVLSKKSRGAGGSKTAKVSPDPEPRSSDDIATPKDIADAFLELNDDEKAECLSRIGCVSFATLRRLREQRERDSAYQVNRRLSEPRTNAPASAHVIFAVLDGGDAALALLGLDWGATPEEVKAAYHRDALIHHPDKGGNAERMADLSKAYTVALRYAERRGKDMTP